MKCITKNIAEPAPELRVKFAKEGGMIHPPFLKAGDKVGLLSTSNFTEKKHIDELVAILKSWKLKPVLGKTIGVREGSFAGSDALRRSDLQQMLDEDEIRAVFETMGGYGITRIIDQINFNKFKYFPKWLVGYSDTTFLHNHVQGMLSTASIHATMAADLVEGYRASSWESLRKALFGKPLQYKIKSHPLNRPGQATAMLVGGNLSILCNSKGTSSEVNTNGKILFLEEVSENQFQLDSFLTSLRRAGKFEYVKGMLIGRLADIKIDAPEFGKTPEEIVLDAVKDYDFPLCFGFPAGHGGVNKALIFGAPLEMVVNEKGAQLTFRACP